MLSTFFCSQQMDIHRQISSDLPSLHVLVVDEDEAARSACLEIAKTLGYKAEGIACLVRVLRLSTGFRPTSFSSMSPSEVMQASTQWRRCMRCIRASPSLQWPR